MNFSADGTVQLDHEIELYSASDGEVVMWVRIPSLDYNDNTTIYMFYGNSDVSTSQENATGVWDPDFVMVHHMAEDPQSSSDGECGGGIVELCDSTSNNNDANRFNDVSRVSAVVGNGADFDGNGDYLEVADSTSLDGATGAGQARTLSFWINIDDAQDEKIITEKSYFSGDHFWFQTVGSAGNIRGGVSASCWPNCIEDSIGEDSWKYVVMTYDGTDERLYVDGVGADGPLSITAPADNNDPFHIGGWIAGVSYSVDAIFDELRVSSTSRPGGWITTEFNNMHSPETFYFINHYTYQQEITLESDEVSGSSNLIDFPVLVTSTLDNLKTVTHGGYVTSDYGYDIIFTANDAAGSIPLDFEMDYYSSSTGEIAAWIKMPILDYNDDSTIYINYGNYDISSSQENIAGVWSANYEGVWHMGDIFNISANTSTDSTSNANDLTTAGLSGSTSYLQPGQIGLASNLNPPSASGDYMFRPDADLTGAIPSKSSGGATDFTISAWTSLYDSTARNPLLNKEGDYGGAIRGFAARPSDASPNPPEFQLYKNDINATYLTADTTATDETWFYTTYSYNYVTDGTSEMNIYYNGALEATSTTAVGPLQANSRDLNLGYYNYNGSFQRTFSGLMDEVRISSDVKTSDWIVTEYNNQSDVASFATVNSSRIINVPEQPGGHGGEIAYESTGELVSSIYDLGASDQNINVITIEQNVPSGCSLEVTLETSDSIIFSTFVSETFSDDDSNYYTATTTDALDNKRWLRYKVDMDACGAGYIYTPSLYSVKIDYE